jgi:hypothetical protein
MFNLLDKNISYILFSPEKNYNTVLENNVNCERACSILYSKDYTIIPVSGHYQGKLEKSFLAISPVSTNDEVRTDAIHLMDWFDQDSVIVKYVGESEATSIKKDGSEKSLKFVIYDSNLENKSYIFNGVSFSFVENKKYYFPKDKNDLRNGMLVEFLNNDEWKQRVIHNVDVEFDKMYKLLIKYGKLRVETA